ncbi:MAG: HAMP domain-containing histidine kinase [Lachnospiraceae bacterium]|nr:HAMP domain-containing histidine kinase [Lachnospiraceae bacterium]
MDIKLKSSHKLRTRIAVLGVIAAVICSLCFFSVIGRKAEEKGKKERQVPENVLVNYEFIENLLRGSHVLYYEHMGYQGMDQTIVDSILLQWREAFEGSRNQLDYYLKDEKGEEKNTTRTLEKLMPGGKAGAKELEELRSRYQCYFTLRFDEEGELSVENVWSQNGCEDEIVKALMQAKRQNEFQRWETEYLEQYAQGEWTISDLAEEQDKFTVKDFQVVYGIPKENSHMVIEYDEASDYLGQLYLYSDSGANALFLASLLLLAMLLLLLTSNRLWKGTVDYSRRGHWYLMEGAIVGIVLICMLWETFLSLNVQYMSLMEGRMPWEVLRWGDIEQVMDLLEMSLMLGLIYGGWYLSLSFIRPLFSLGVRKYIREYSLIYYISTKGVTAAGEVWTKAKYEISHVDFSDKTIRTIRKVVILNFVVLAVLSFFWFFGIFALAIYSITLFFLLKNQYDKMEREYQRLMHATSRIAQGDLQYEDDRDWGVFEPFKAELLKIRQGFSKAVEREVHSERMKTELITNVSHDLKTPLTAITTYVELMKDEDITPQQRSDYLQVLEKKSLQLKLLVENLLDVSKATSNTIKLDLMEVDVANLLKQVCVEHEMGFQKLNLELKWKLPEGKIIRRLDNQKTWRIFENLFVNIEKYAMPGSRVFIEVGELQDVVSVMIKNMSAEELNISGEEITERFVRGDSSRTTEGCGLGLAIAKSFTEAMGGTFEVTVDGDLFKVEIRWEKGVNE